MIMYILGLPLVTFHKNVCFFGILFLHMYIYHDLGGIVCGYKPMYYVFRCCFNDYSPHFRSNPRIAGASGRLKWEYEKIR